MFHLLNTDIEPPAALNNPFCYEPHALTLAAARKLCEYISTQTAWETEIAAGKMFGVLVCRDCSGNIGFLAAYSGQIGGRGDWPWFVPAVFDYLNPSGYFMQEEAQIAAINHELEELEATEEYRSLCRELEIVTKEGDDAISAYRHYMQECKKRRDTLRASGEYDEAMLIRESQYQKAELRRMRHRRDEDAAALRSRLQPFTDRRESLLHERHKRSDALQQWLFNNFTLLNARGERRTLTSIFADTPQGTPPSGAGECCAPKLLHYAFMQNLKPLCIGEFWQGRSPQAEVRHHGQFYPACRGKCKPILEWMLGTDNGSSLLQATLQSCHGNEKHSVTPCVKYIDESIIVVDKPSGLLSVPGRQGLPSVESILHERYGSVFMPHRLDQDTSGLLVAARNMEAYRNLQRQFLERKVSKEYEALLDGVHPLAATCPPSDAGGIISLPLRPDITDRPRQLVDHLHGKAATTYYSLTGVENGYTRVVLVPHTGRTHQLRVHCAHKNGLGMPIVGDNLYGRHTTTGDIARTETCASRLCLHARKLSFQHPVTQRQLTFTSPTPF